MVSCEVTGHGEGGRLVVGMWVVHLIVILLR